MEVVSKEYGRELKNTGNTITIDETGDETQCPTFHNDSGIDLQINRSIRAKRSDSEYVCK